jgi:pyrroloquinoline quinone (PQQ) biosynthesis protein C
MVATVLTAEQFLEELNEERRQTHAFRHHPMSKLWLDGKLSRDHIRAFFREFEWFARSAPRLFFCIGANCPDGLVDDQDWRVRQVVNLIDDVGLGGSPSHHALYRNLAYALGLAKEELDGLTQEDFLPTTLAHVETFMALAKRHPFYLGLVGVGLAGEAAVSDGTMGALGQALINQFGLRWEDVRFLVDREEELEHGNIAADAVIAYANTAEAQEEMRKAFRQGIQTWHTFMDGIYYRLVLPTL